MQKKIDQIKENNNIQDWDSFVKEVKTAFSKKNKIANIKWKIKAFKQEKKHIMDFIIKFEVLAMKDKTDDMYVISYWRRILEVILSGLY